LHPDREHRALPRGVDEGYDHTGALPWAHLEVGLDRSRSQRRGACTAELVVTDRGHEVGYGTRSGERHGLVGSRPAGGNDDPGSCIAPPVEGPKGDHDDVDHDVADNYDHWLLNRGRHRWAA
jgi:hypothetical protein